MDYLICALVILIYNVSDVFCVLCSEKRYSYGYTYFSCTYGCCGSTYNRYCCSRSSYSYHTSSYLSSGASAAIGICVICFFTAVIIAALCYKKKYHGRVLRAGTVGPQHMNTVHVTHTTSMAGPVQQPYPMYPPPSYAQMPPPMQPSPSAPMHGAPNQPGYIPPPPTYAAPSQPYGAPPPSYNVAQTFPRGKY